MKEDQPGQTTDRGNRNRSFLERIGYALIGDISDKPELLEQLKKAQQNNIIATDTLSMIEGVIKVTDTQVREVMIPRSQMVVLRKDDTVDEVLSTIVESAHSRFPVIDENRDDIEGIILAKDLIGFFSREVHDVLDFKEFLRPAVFIPESKRLNVLLTDFRNTRNHMAIVVDEYGGVSGLVTIEDVLEQIVGNIEDEYDIDDESQIIPHGNGVYSVQSLITVEDFNDYFKTHYNEDGAFDTVGGLIMNAFGYMPKRGEEIAMGEYLFKITRSDHRRIYQLKVTRLDKNAAE